MKIFMWVQNKFTRSNQHRTPAPCNIPPSAYDEPKVQCREDLGEWPRCLLAIGTLGSDGGPSGRAETEIQLQNESASTRQDFDMDEARESEFLEEVERNKAMPIPTSWKEQRLETKVTSSIGKAAPSLLIKKMFVCGGGFTLVSSSRDPMPESRVDKMWRAILRKKIHPRTSAQALHTGRYLEHKQFSPRFSRSNQQEHEDPKEASRIKWDRTDSECPPILFMASKQDPMAIPFQQRLFPDQM